MTSVLVTGLCLSCGRGGPSAKVHPKVASDIEISKGTVRDEGSAVSRGGVPSAGSLPRFEDVATDVGVRFSPFNDHVPGRFFLPEIMGSGAAWLDYDRDGRFDLYLTNGSQLDATAGAIAPHANQLFRQYAPDEFVSVTADSYGGDRGFGQSVAVGDFDADGFPDMFVANYGRNVMLHNNGDGTFSDISSLAAVGDDDAWSSSAVWLDINGDSWLDLYVVNYLHATLANNEFCEANGAARYCGPRSFPAEPDQVFLNLGDGGFEEAAARLGMQGTDAPGNGCRGARLRRRPARRDLRRQRHATQFFV